MPRSLQARLPRAPLAVAAVAVVVTALHLAGYAADSPFVAPLGFAEQASIFLALVLAFRASRLSAPDLRPPWRLVTAGLALTVTASTAAAVFALITGRRPQSPMPLDVVYLSAYGFYIAAALRLPRRPRRLTVRDVLDGIAAAVLVGITVGRYVVEPIARAASTAGLTVVTNFVYAAADLTLLWVVVTVLLTSRRLRLVWIAVLAAGLTLLVSGDLAYLAMTSQEAVEAESPIFLVFLWGFLGVSLAAWMSARSAGPREAAEGTSAWERPAFQTLPLIMLVGVTAVVAAEAAREDFRPYVVLGGLAVALLLALRQVITLRENRLLLARERDVVYRLQELDRMRGDFVAMVSHDFANPLTAIRGMASLLRHRGGELSAEERLEMLEAIETEADRLSALARDVLAAVRAEAGELSYTFAPLDLAALADRCTRLAGQLSDRHEIAFQRSGDGVIDGDEARLQEALLNLLDNAIKYSPQGGTVTVRVRGDRDRVRMEVSDQGVGIRPEDAERVFERMIRVRDEATREIPGTGLGLYIVRRIVDAHGGRVGAEGRPGKGTTFTVELPRERPDSAAAVEEAERSPREGSR